MQTRMATASPGDRLLSTVVPVLLSEMLLAVLAVVTGERRRGGREKGGEKGGKEKGKIREGKKK